MGTGLEGNDNQRWDGRSASVLRAAIVKQAGRSARAQAGFKRASVPAEQLRLQDRDGGPSNTAAFDRAIARRPNWSHATAHQLLKRYGVVFRETAHAENLPGGFSAIYDVLKAMEESGPIRRGYFAADLGATQFAMPAAVDLLRSLA